jgi:hypothetical protein
LPRVFARTGSAGVRAALAGAMLLAASSAAAQSPTPAQPVPAFLPRAAFHFQWAALVANDVRFDWHGIVGFDIDAVDYGRGRATFSAEYEAVLGHERRLYDLNHGNYRFEATGSYRAGATEIALLTVHVSRHLSDREQPAAVSWNLIGVRVLRPLTRGRSMFDTQASFGFAGQQAFVDYDWIADARVAWRHPIDSRVDLISTGTGILIGVNEEAAGRPNLCGGRIEGGIRINGARAALELFAGYERRVDAFPADRFRVRMFTAGFRLVSR